ncbi:hypothetical protein TSUD_19470 [Trifolium subterraneum]|uniref:Uncharacterized protein n=1 Tax=Trifolium subterraneum TaxID=3900 RepID=A0A2Z6NXR2_TRISU|nr:hypothetical protein TSUD_19470 [Trifolium subterraneum]
MRFLSSVHASSNSHTLGDVSMENNLQGGFNVEPYPVNRFLTDLPICVLSKSSNDMRMETDRRWFQSKRYQLAF